MDDHENPYPEPIVLPPSDTLDLHTFKPSELNDLLDDWLEECLARGFTEVRVIHGKGRGVLRRRVQALLDRHPAVAAYRLDNPGATVARLKRPA